MTQNGILTEIVHPLRGVLHNLAYNNKKINITISNDIDIFDICIYIYTGLN